MGCPITRHFNLDCKDSKGGVKLISFASFPANGTSYVPTIVSGVITTWAGAAQKFLKYETRTGIATGNSKATVSKANGTSFNADALALQLEKLSADKWAELKNLMKDRLLALVQDRNGKYFLHGYYNGLDVSEIDGQYGAGMGDFNGYKIAITGEEEDAPLEVSSSIVAALYAP